MCDKIPMPGGGFAIICRGHKQRTKVCAVCGKGRGVKLCDYPTGGKKLYAGGKNTCDRPLCDNCAVHKDPDQDFCPYHAKMLSPEGRLKL